MQYGHLICFLTSTKEMSHFLLNETITWFHHLSTESSDR